MTTLTASSGNGRCNAFAPSHDARIQTSRTTGRSEEKAALLSAEYPQSQRRESLWCDGDLRTNSQAISSLVRLKKKIHRRGAHRSDKFRSTRAVGCPMRDEFASYSFRAVTIAGLVLLCSGLVAIAFT
jgi:hypothetical protein